LSYVVSPFFSGYFGDKGLFGFFFAQASLDHNLILGFPSSLVHNTTPSFLLLLRCGPPNFLAWAVLDPWSSQSQPPNSLGWQACATLPSYWLGWGSCECFLPGPALNSNPPDLSLPSS
jgi:hypothetical protein